MKVLNLYAPSDLRFEEKEMPKCKDDEVLVEIKNCGICGSDIGRIFVTGTYHFPTIPGHEFSGKVIFDPENVFTGKRVAVFPLLPCFECDMCRRQQYAQCRNYNYYGSRCDGGYAEYIAVKKFNLIELPDNVSYEEGAMCEPVAVAIHAARKSDIKKGEAVLISGAGSIGIIAAQRAMHLGAEKVFFIDIDKEKIEFCKKMSFYEYNENEKIDKAIEGTGAGNALSILINAINPSGKIVLMGNPSKNMELEKSCYQTILRKEILLEGTWNSSYSETQNDWKDALWAMAEGKLNLKPLITHKVPLDKGKELLEMMKSKKEFYCKAMLEVNRDTDK